MKKHHFFYLLVPVTTVACMLISSCQKSNNPVTQPITTGQGVQLMAATNALHTSTVSDNESVNDVVASADVIDSSSHCAIITFNPSKSVYPHQKIIDYGSGCPADDGHTRKGKKIITVLIDPKNAAPGDEITEITFENYYLDSNNITGVIKGYLLSSNNPGPRQMKFISDKTIFSPNGDKNIVKGTHIFTLVEGANTIKRKDDVYQITGYAEGSESLDSSTIFTWTTEIDSAHPVIKPVECDHRTKGGVKINIHVLKAVDSTYTAYLDYGDGTCDEKATLSINGSAPKDIMLPLSFWPFNL